jgi:hypothetical protein
MLMTLHTCEFMKAKNWIVDSDGTVKRLLTVKPKTSK